MAAQQILLTSPVDSPVRESNPPVINISPLWVKFDTTLPPSQNAIASSYRSFSNETQEFSSSFLSFSLPKITASIQKSRVFSKPSPPPPSSVPKDAAAPPIRWRKGELIGCGAFGRVYMGINLGFGELLAVKQAHIKELEEEVKLLKNLSHPNIVRYLGTLREEEPLNILLEFVPGGSISSLLGKFGSFPEAVMRTYTKQLLLGLEYLHKNGIMHRDIKLVKRHAAEIFTSVILSCIFSLYSTALIGRLVGLESSFAVLLAFQAAVLFNSIGIVL